MLLRMFRVWIGWNHLSTLWNPLLFMLLWPLNQRIKALRDAQRNIWWGLVKNFFPLQNKPQINIWRVDIYVASFSFFNINQPYQCGHCKLFSVDLLTLILGLEQCSQCSNVLPSYTKEQPGLTIFINSQNICWAPTVCHASAVLGYGEVSQLVCHFLGSAYCW